MAGAAFHDVLGDIAGVRNVEFFHTKCVSRMGRVRSPKRRVRDDDFIVGSCSDYPPIVFLLAKPLQGVSAELLTWQAQYLVKLVGDSCC